MEDGVPTGADEAPDDHQDDAEQNLTLEQLDDSDDDEGDCEEPE
jgi:hypothetical protein